MINTSSWLTYDFNWSIFCLAAFRFRSFFRIFFTLDLFFSGCILLKRSHLFLEGTTTTLFSFIFSVNNFIWSFQNDVMKVKVDVYHPIWFIYQMKIFWKHLKWHILIIPSILSKSYSSCEAIKFTTCQSKTQKHAIGNSIIRSLDIHV